MKRVLILFLICCMCFNLIATIPTDYYIAHEEFVYGGLDEGFGWTSPWMLIGQASITTQGDPAIPFHHLRLKKSASAIRYVGFEVIAPLKVRFCVKGKNTRLGSKLQLLTNDEVCEEWELGDIESICLQEHIFNTVIGDNKLEFRLIAQGANETIYIDDISVEYIENSEKRVGQFSEDNK